MFKIKTVEIDGFWGNYKLCTNLNDDVNIFIGPNGSGKTTFINFLEATLTADLDLLESLQFKEIKLRLQDDSHTRTILVQKMQDTPFDILRYRISRNNIELPLIPEELSYKRRRVYPEFFDAISEIQSQLRRLVNISWISVHREILDDEWKDPATRRTEPEKNPVDRRIQDLTKRFTKYQLQLQSEINSLSDRFRRNVLVSMLYHKSLDTFSLTQEKQDFQALGSGLVNTYSDLGVLDPDVKGRIDEHVAKIERSIMAIDEYQKDKEKVITIDDILPSSLLNRTRHVLDLSTTLENDKKEILKPVQTYLDILKSFATDKEFQLNPDHSGEILIKIGKTNLSLEQLSSGEKQLFILLTEALLQKGESFVFLADEPELSLHIEWQRKIVKSIRTLNQHSQIILATHSPEVGGGWRNKIIGMKEIIYG